ncbi:endonuclease domain-containing protein [Brevundimonas sp. GCM10030266]|uniref:endonuclease domain-containing protein n=1 Tax=Brevundimonas sp. GCM10030266 TaxID=3273386 RepID=UPI003608AF97
MTPPLTHERARRLRRPLSPPEARLWVRVRAHRLHGFKFRRQHPFGPYILDFYCAAARMAVEVDGRVHDDPDRAEHDLRRTRWLASQGVRVIRIAADDVKNELDGVLAFIARVVRERLADPSVTSRRRDAPPPHCVER